MPRHDNCIYYVIIRKTVIVLTDDHGIPETISICDHLVRIIVKQTLYVIVQVISWVRNHSN